MPSKESHVETAKRNQQTIDHLLANDDHLAWAVTVSFYKALHVVETLLCCDAQSPCKHTDDHKSRNKLLKRTRRYEAIYRLYRPLQDASLVARYLQSEPGSTVYDDFSKYMDRQAVENMAIGHYLRQIENSAKRLLGEPDLFDATEKLPSLRVSDGEREAAE